MNVGSHTHQPIWLLAGNEHERTENDRKPDSDKRTMHKRALSMMPQDGNQPVQVATTGDDNGLRHTTNLAPLRRAQSFTDVYYGQSQRNNSPENDLAENKVQMQENENRNKQRQKTRPSSIGNMSHKANDDETFVLQQQIRTFMKKTNSLTLEKTQLEAYIAHLQSAVDQLNKHRGKMGGYYAVTVNEKSMKKHHVIMEKRLSKASQELMDATARNARTREEVDKQRREKLALQAAIKRFQSDEKKLLQSIEQLEQTKEQHEDSKRDVEATIEGIAEETKIRLGDLESKYDALQERINQSSFDLDLPAPRSVVSNGLPDSLRTSETETQEDTIAKTIHKRGFGTVFAGVRGLAANDPASQSRTQTSSSNQRSRRDGRSRSSQGQSRRTGTGRLFSGYMPGHGTDTKRTDSFGHTNTGRRSSRRYSLSDPSNKLLQSSTGIVSSSVVTSTSQPMSWKQLWDQVARATGIKTPEEFADRFTEGNDLNFTLFGRLDGLSKDAEKIREDIQRCRDQVKATRQETRILETERDVVLNKTQAYLDSMNERRKRQAGELARLTEAQRQLVIGVRNLLETLEISIPIPEGNDTQSRDLMRLYTMLEYRLKQVLSAYAKFSGNAPTKPSTTTSSQTTTDIYGKKGSSDGLDPLQRNTKKSQLSGAALSSIERRQAIELSIMDIRRGMLAAASNAYVSNAPNENKKDEHTKPSTKQQLTSSINQSSINQSPSNQSPSNHSDDMLVHIQSKASRKSSLNNTMTQEQQSFVQESMNSSSNNHSPNPIVQSSNNNSTPEDVYNDPSNSQKVPFENSIQNTILENTKNDVSLELQNDSMSTGSNNKNHDETTVENRMNISSEVEINDLKTNDQTNDQMNDTGVSNIDKEQPIQKQTTDMDSTALSDSRFLGGASHDFDGLFSAETRPQSEHLLDRRSFLVGPESVQRAIRTSVPRLRAEVPSTDNEKSVEAAEYATLDL